MIADFEQHFKRFKSSAQLPIEINPESWDLKDILRYVYCSESFWSFEDGTRLHGQSALALDAISYSMGFVDAMRIACALHEDRWKHLPPDHLIRRQAAVTREHLSRRHDNIAFDLVYELAEGDEPKEYIQGHMHGMGVILNPRDLDVEELLADVFGIRYEVRKLRGNIT